METPLRPGPEDHEAYEPPQTAAGRHAELVAEVRRTRRTFHVSSDDASVNEIVRRIEAGDPEIEPGMCMTRAEMRDHRDARAPYEDCDALFAYTDRHPETYGGCALEQAGERLWWEFRFTRDLAEHEVALKAIAPAGVHIVVREAHYSAEAVKEVTYAIGDATDELTALGLDVRSLEHDDEGVLVGVVTADPEGARKLLRERFGPMARLDWLGSETHEVVSVPWGSFVADTPMRLVVFYFTNAFYEQWGADVREDAEAVTITVRERRRVAKAELLPGSSRKVEVELGQPLGDRAVIDGADGTPRFPWSPGRG
ncbi:MAG: hypothetical protein QOI98_2839 [Solirubrobacteraceae bacterium]|nr:hypothetical protein [Solirubrobacteraceae bacterium]